MPSLVDLTYNFHCLLCNVHGMGGWLRWPLLYVFPCVILFLCFSVLLVLRVPRLGKRELILVLFVRLFGLCLFRFVGFLFLLGSGKGCGLWLWHSLDFSLTFFFIFLIFLFGCRFVHFPKVCLSRLLKCFSHPCDLSTHKTRSKSNFIFETVKNACYMFSNSVNQFYLK